MSFQKKEEITVSRRNLLKGAALGGAGLATGGLLGGLMPASASVSGKWDLEADVVCVGYGGAGAITAITAADLGASVIIIEKQPHDTATEIRHTPNTRSSGGSIICPTDAQKASDHLFSLSWGTTPKDICDAWGKYGVTNVQWIEQMGGTLIPESEYSAPGEFPLLPGFDSIRVRQYLGGGQSFFKFLDDNVVKRSNRIRVIYESPGKELVVDPNGAVVGVIATNGGKQVRIRGRKAVVLTCGGYEWDEEFKANTLRGYPAYFYGNPDNTGDGIRMAAKVGAAMWHLNTISGRVIPYKPGHKPGFQLGTPNGFILVDKYGKRFFRERPWAAHSVWLEVCKFDTERSEYPALPCYSIFDDTALKLGPPATGAYKGVLPDGKTRPRYYTWSKDYAEEIASGFLMKGETLEDLVKVIVADKENGNRMNPEVLRSTIETYNKYCAAKKDADFGRNPATLIPVQKGPFYAMKMYPGGPNTQGGPKKNAAGQVLDPFNAPIPHLYCVGELGSIYGFLYPTGGGNLCEMLIFGRIAGESAVTGKHLTATAKPVAAAATVASAAAVATSPSKATPAVAAPVSSKEECLQCHGPFTKLSSAQPGYVTQNGEKINPHRFIPHGSTEAKAVPECLDCHTPHTKTSAPKVDLSKVDVHWCYDSCHHQNNFQPCKQCHDGR